MKKTRKKNEIACKLSGWAMELANFLRYKEGWTPTRAANQAWLCLHALEALGEGVVMLDFNKQDGTRRLARGTLCQGVSEAYDRYEYKGKSGVRKTEEGYFTFCYWDLDEGGFRSFNAARLNEFKTLIAI